jgi:phosphoesterase RecJ-like protein
MLAFGIAARNNGKDVVASFGSPFDVPANLRFLPTDLLVAPGDFPEQPETMVVFDAGSADRLGELGTHAGKATTLIVLDHHATNEGFGDVAVIDSSAAATGEIVFELFGLLGWDIDSQIATCLHTSLVTDTGRFSYSNTTSETLRIGAELLEAGAVPSEISRHVYEETPFGYLKVSALALSRAHLDEERGIVTASVTDEDLDTAGIDWGDVDGLIDTLRLAQEADVAALAKVHDDGRVKVSLRSRGATDVGSLAAKMGGGGHRLAAGFTVERDPEEVLEEVRQSVGDFR